MVKVGELYHTQNSHFNFQQYNISEFRANLCIICNAKTLKIMNEILGSLGKTHMHGVWTVVHDSIPIARIRPTSVGYDD